MSEKQTPKARFSTKLPSGDFLGVTIWQGKSDPNAEVVNKRDSTGRDPIPQPNHARKKDRAQT